MRDTLPNSASKLALGTAQFGFDYGATNDIGQIPRDEGAEILRIAQEYGVGALDTASAYGEAESVLGTLGTEGFDVITKISLPPKGSRISESWVIEQIEASLIRLRRSSLSAVLLHAPQELQGPNGKRLIAGMIKARQAGLTAKVGVSIYEPNDLHWISELLDLQIVQAPLNVFDRRLITTGWLRRLSARGVEVHVRSVFLQGSLLTGTQALPKFLLPWADEFLHFESWAESQGLSPLEGTLGFPLSVEGVDKIVVGVTSAQQLKQVVLACKTSVVSYPTFSSEDSRLINPVNWPQ